MPKTAISRYGADLLNPENFIENGLLWKKAIGEEEEPKRETANRPSTGRTSSEGSSRDFV